MNYLCLSILINALLFNISFLLAPSLHLAVSLYITNHREFQVSLYSLLYSLSLLLCCIFAVSSLFTYYLIKNSHTLLLSLYFALCVSIYIQGDLLVWNYGVFDGSVIKWNENNIKGIIEIIIWLTIFFVSLLNHKRIYRSLRSLSLFSLSFLFITSYPLYSTFKEIPPKQSVKTTNSHLDSTFKLSKDKNLILIVLDTFSSPAFDKILEINPSLKTELSGFTYFPDTLAGYRTTAPSIPLMLTGSYYDNKEVFSEFQSRVLQQSVPNKLTSKGWRSSVVSLPTLCPAFNTETCVTISEIVASDPKYLERSELLSLIDLFIFRISPHFSKQYIYNDGNWLVQQHFGVVLGPKLQAESVLLGNKAALNISNDATKPSFLMLHLFLPHPPYGYNEKCEYIPLKLPKPKKPKDRYQAQAMCALKLALDIVNTVKKQAIWENSAIVITADHGSQNKYLSYKRPKGFPPIERALPLFLVKPAGVKNNTNSLEISDKKLTLGNLAQILEMLAEGLDLNNVLAKVPVAEKRVYRHYDWQNKDWYSSYLSNMRGYVIEGAARDVRNWRRGEERED